MIIGIGHDAVAIRRFEHWYSYPKKKLRRVFSEQEITYCLQEPIKSAERFAARFATKEALYKALCQAGYSIPFLTLCAQSEVILSPQGPQMQLVIPKSHAKIALSITHTELYAYALAILQD